MKNYISIVINKLFKRLGYISYLDHHIALSQQLYKLDIRRIQEIDNLKFQLDPLIAKLVKIYVYEPKYFAGSRTVYRVCAEIEPDLIREFAVWGNDSDIFRMMAERLAHLIEKELHTINFSRTYDFKEIDSLIDEANNG